MTVTFGVDTPCRNHRGPDCYACNGSGVVRGPQAVARRDDVETSHQAAASISSERIRQSQRIVLDILKRHGPLCDEELVRYTSGLMSESGARTRRAELCAKGLVEASGKYETTASGRRSIVWMASE